MNEPRLIPESISDRSSPRARSRASADLDLDLERGSVVGDASATALPQSNRPYERLPSCETKPTPAQLEQRVADLTDELDRVRHAASIDLQNVQADIVAKNRELGRIKAELTRVREESPNARIIREVLDYWKLRLGHQKAKTPVAGKRGQKVQARLNDHFTVDQLKRAVDGCALMPYVGPHGRVATEAPGTERHDDLELILRDETTVERFIGYAERHARPSLFAAAEPEPRRRPADSTAPIDRVTSALNDVGITVRAAVSDPDSWSACCPAHDDTEPSLSIHRKPSGRVLIHCFAGCPTEDVLNALNLEWSDLFENAEHDRGADDFQHEPSGISPENRRTLAQIESYLRQEDARAA